MRNDNVEKLKYINECIESVETILKQNFRSASPESTKVKYSNAFRRLKVAYYASDDDMSILDIALKYGIELSNNVGCYFEFKENNYWITCPIMTASFPGISLGASMSGYCSICGEVLIDCAHITGELYNEIECKRFNEKCNICLESTCSHIVGQLYDNVTAIHMINEIDKVDHISLVNNPEDCEVGIESLQLGKRVMWYRGKLEHDNFSWGDPIECLYCKSLEPNMKYVKINLLGR